MKNLQRLKDVINNLPARQPIRWPKSFWWNIIKGIFKPKFWNCLIRAITEVAKKTAKSILVNGGLCLLKEAGIDVLKIIELRIKVNLHCNKEPSVVLCTWKRVQFAIYMCLTVLQVIEGLLDWRQLVISVGAICSLLMRKATTCHYYKFTVDLIDCVFQTCLN